MEALRARLDRLEQQVENLHERLNDILEALAAQWQTLTDAARPTSVRGAKPVAPPGSLEGEHRDGPSAS